MFWSFGRKLLISLICQFCLVKTEKQNSIFQLWIFLKERESLFLSFDFKLFFC